MIGIFPSQTMGTGKLINRFPASSQHLQYLRSVSFELNRRLIAVLVIEHLSSKRSRNHYYSIPTPDDNLPFGCWCGIVSTTGSTLPRLNSKKPKLHPLFSGQKMLRAQKLAHQKQCRVICWGIIPALVHLPEFAFHPSQHYTFPFT